MVLHDEVDSSPAYGVWDAALAVGRVLITNNVVDFERLRRHRSAIGEPAPPLIYTSEAAFPKDRQFVAHLVVAVEHARQEPPGPGRRWGLWLAPAPKP